MVAFATVVLADVIVRLVGNVKGLSGMEISYPVVVLSLVFTVVVAYIGKSYI